MKNEQTLPIPARSRRLGAVFSVAVAAFLFAGTTARSQKFDFGIEGDTLRCGGYGDVQAVVWWGRDPHMTTARLAAYCAPVLWFSPDEPLLGGQAGKEIRIPEAFPFEPPADRPVVYYRLRSLITREGPAGENAFKPDAGDRGESVMDLDGVVGVDLDFFFYYPAEVGLGVHKHDVESIEMQAVVWKREKCPDAPYHVVITKVVGKAHGIEWYDNTLGVDEYTKFPIHIFSEEGKHASCPDKNADGYFTPGYDVNRRVNDAWGVRDVIRSGTLYTPGYQSWMAKIREPQHRVFPPLPEDSPLRAQYATNGVYSPDNAVYELRPFPSAAKAEPDLVRFIADKGDTNWPEQVEAHSFKQFAKWVDQEAFVKSISVAFYADGNYGVSIAFPFFIVKNLEDPLAGGYITHRMAFTGKDLRDFMWVANYSASASRWMDPYFAAGYETDKGDASTRSYFVMEMGLKFRSGLSHTPLRVLTRVADFWGVRFGVKTDGFFEIDRLRYVVEIGAGTW